ncbi:class I mannose-6-phosphate isomerase [Acidiferrimicrobium sp. IK]|uniref:class I mannose-6-phosphate isomerase n=1 Tax=Acidiferrimicrobium sp. IK TaxID=2871700 RepID=UPI0021CB29AC|nr:class I mannose-6-phosphate isomerase [Acidiferrimicrobium sp. IK]MCU4186716.1 class I mannose-6-phosphate isomerase [Acidiferrimicrobium sp. IK]
MSTPAPVVLPPNRPRQFYRAGTAAIGFRGGAALDPYRPEEWLASTTLRWGTSEGRSTLPDGRLLVDALRDDPAGWLGPEHAARFGDDPALLVKLLDAGERLPVHVHPTREYAYRHLGSLHGKTEAWVVLATGTGAAGAAGGAGSVWLGWRRDMDAVEVARLVETQAHDRLLASLHEIRVRPGDSVLVPAATPHAIGPEVFCVELQEPTDFSLNLEWAGFDLPDGAGGQLGLDAGTVLRCVERGALTPAELDRLRSTRDQPAGPVTRLLPPEADPYFRAERVDGRHGAALDAGFAVLVATSGAGALQWGRDGSLPLAVGTALLVPWAAGPMRVTGPVQLIVCRPPRPSDAPRPPRTDAHPLAREAHA